MKVFPRETANKGLTSSSLLHKKPLCIFTAIRRIVQPTIRRFETSHIFEPLGKLLHQNLNYERRAGMLSLRDPWIYTFLRIVQSVREGTANSFEATFLVELGFSCMEQGQATWSGGWSCDALCD
jgi:hypothetical protein